MNNMNNVNVMYNELSNENHSGLYTSQAAESYLRFLATASPCSDWLLCQAEAVQAKTATLCRCGNAYSYHSM